MASPGLTFQARLDSRRAVLPDQGDLTNDLMAAVHCGDTLEAICLELEAEARADALNRLLMYLARLWTEPGWRDSLAIACVSGVILDLTGRSPVQELSLRSAIISNCRLELALRSRTHRTALGAVRLGAL